MADRGVMPPGPETLLEIHVHVSCPAPARLGPSLGLVVALVLFWPLILVGFVIWITFTLLLTFAGLAIAAGGVVVWGLGKLLELRWPDAGVDVVNVGWGLARGMVRSIDAMNGHSH